VVNSNDIWLKNQNLLIFVCSFKIYFPQFSLIIAKVSNRMLSDYNLSLFNIMQNIDNKIGLNERNEKTVLQNMKCLYQYGSNTLSQFLLKYPEYL